MSNSPRSSFASDLVFVEFGPASECDDVRSYQSCDDWSGVDSDEEYTTDEGDVLSISSSSASTCTSGSVSITSSLYQHVHHNGRRYHVSGPDRYPLPNDQVEQDREDLNHLVMLMLTHGQHFLAPISNNPVKILDLGTGTGAWAMEVGDLFPSTAIIGVDLSPIQPQWSPPNVSFYVDDVDDEWLNGSGFDLVHARHLFPFLRDPSVVARKAFENIKPNGWIEIQDLNWVSMCDDNTMDSGYHITKFLNAVSASCDQRGTDLRIAPRLGDILVDAGFVNVACKTIQVPIGAWAESFELKSVGMHFQTVMHMLIPALCHAPGMAAFTSADEKERFIDECQQSLRDASVRSYMNFHFWMGQKPTIPGSHI